MAVYHAVALSVLAALSTHDQVALSLAPLLTDVLAVLRVALPTDNDTAASSASSDALVLFRDGLHAVLNVLRAHHDAQAPFSGVDRTALFRAITDTVVPRLAQLSAGMRCNVCYHAIALIYR